MPATVVGRGKEEYQNTSALRSLPLCTSQPGEAMDLTGVMRTHETLGMF